MDQQLKTVFQIISNFQFKKPVRVVAFFIFIYIIYLSEFFISEYFHIPRNAFLKNKLLLNLLSNQSCYGESC